ncbi:MAG: DUF1801 domain-containing protein [Bacteroidia bacterium]
MQSKAATPDQYVKQLPSDRKEVIEKLRAEVKKNLPKGFQEIMNYGMIGYVVPHSLYPGGYHCTPELPLPFANIASQKNFIAFYHMGIYGSPKLLKWFTDEYSKHAGKKIDMGKACMRFKKPEDVPVKLLGELMGKITVDEWIRIYETNIAKSKTGKAKIEKAKKAAAKATKVGKKK